LCTRLKNLKSTESILALGVSIGSQPIGLIIAEITLNTNHAQILSLFVKPKYRNSGIGTALIVRLERYIIKSSFCKILELNYSYHSATVSALERLLNKQGWSQPQPQMLLCYSTTNILKNAPWLYSYLLPSSFRIFPLVELTVEEYQAIQQQQVLAPWYPEILSPFKGELPVEPLNSLGLHYQGQVVGWMATHRISPDTIRYTSLFVRKDLQKMGRAIPLIAEAIKLQVNSNISHCTCGIIYNNEPMVRFVRRRLSPFLNEVQEIKRVYKYLHP